MRSTNKMGINISLALVVVVCVFLNACNRMPDPPDAVAAGADDSTLIAYAKAEDDYAAAFFKQHEKIYNTLLKEMEGRKPTVKEEIKPDGQSFTAPDGKTKLYIKGKGEVYLHKAEGGEGEDELVYKESDPTFAVKLTPSASGRYLFIESFSGSSSEVSFLISDLKNSKPRLISPREEGHLHRVDHFDGPYFWVLSNQKAPNRKLFVTPVGQPGQSGWNTAVMHNDTVYLDDYLVTDGKYLVMILRSKLATRIQITQITGAAGGSQKIDNAIGFNEPHGRITDLTYEPESGKLVFHYSSIKTPLTCYAYDIKSRKLTIRWKRQVKGYNQENFRAKTMLVTTPSGQELYFGFMQRQDLAYTDGSNPLLIAVEDIQKDAGTTVFNPANLSLMERGYAMVFLDEADFNTLPEKDQLSALESILAMMVKEKNTSANLISIKSSRGSCAAISRMMTDAGQPFQSVIMINPEGINNAGSGKNTPVFLTSIPEIKPTDETFGFIRSASAVREQWNGDQILLISSGTGAEPSTPEQMAAEMWTFLLKDRKE